MYERGPDDKQMAALAQWGIKPENIVTASVQVWPDNKAAAQLFLAMRTQWRTGPSGAVGLDYGVLPEIWRLLSVPRNERTDRFNELRIIEVAALNEMHRKTD